MRHSRIRSALFGGSVAGNEELTTVTGLLLIVLLAVLGITIVLIRQLIWLHLFLGLLLLGPVLLKLASTGYRFVRYYTRNHIYLARGAPHLFLRALGPAVVVSTIVVFVSGIVLMFDGPGRRDTPLVIHKVSFIVWLVATGLHVLGHVPGMGRTLGAAREDAGVALTGPGAAGRWIALTGAVVAGVVVALALVPHFSLWTTPGAFPHHPEH